MSSRTLGRIVSLPTVRRRTVNLGYKHMLKNDTGGGDWFERDGIPPLGAESHMRNNPRLAQHNLPLNPGEPPATQCACCRQRLGDVYDYARQDKAPLYQGVKIETTDQR